MLHSRSTRPSAQHAARGESAQTTTVGRNRPEQICAEKCKTQGMAKEVAYGVQRHTMLPGWLRATSVAFPVDGGLVATGQGVRR